MADPVIPAAPEWGRGRRTRALLRSVLGEALRQERLEQGRTLADVAMAARISLPYLSEVERGRKEVSSEVLAALCDALGIDLSDLLVAVVLHLNGESVAGESIVASLAVGRRVAVDGLGTAAGNGPGVVAPPMRRRGDAYALAA
nr:helix-turn-helix transcriptional regulator [Allorhizocola rhizosphaerae]